MRISGIPFGTTDWSGVEQTEHRGATGTATWRTRQFGDIRVRRVEYAPGYLADHWCVKGTSCSAWKANCIPNWRMDAASC